MTEIPETLRLMAVHAHPDDESSKGAATMARYVAEGVDVMVVTCTGGERGSVLNPKLDRPEIVANIAEIRRLEMEAARAILGVRQEWLGFVDSGLPEGDPLPPLPAGCFGLKDPQVAAEPLVRIIREFRPHVITTYDEDGGYEHPDHIMCHRVSVVAFDAAGDPDRFPGTGEPWQPWKLYYDVVFSREKMETLHEAMLKESLVSPFEEWLKAWRKRDEERATETAVDAGGTGRRAKLSVTTRVRCDDYFHVRDEALRAHATQVDPDGFWFHIPMALQRAAWPTEDFALVRSLVDTTVPEDDLFAGVRSKLGVPALPSERTEQRGVVQT